jgi:hypothetical protein
MRYHTGEAYEGNWIDDMKNGAGSLTLSDGSVLTGNWRSDSLWLNAA